MRKQLPDVVGGVRVERVHVSYLGAESDASRPRKAAMHTTEGSFESAHSIFLRENAPNVLIGYDANRKLRVIEYAPIGVMAHALRHLVPPETNRWCVYQVEIAAFRQLSSNPLLAPDKRQWNDEIANLLAAIMGVVKEKGAVPLRRGGDGTRSLSNWTTQPGWFGHLEVPGNDHTDPGALRYAPLFKLAADLLAPWKLSKDGVVLARGTLFQLARWVHEHKDRIRKLGGVNLRRNR